MIVLAHEYLTLPKKLIAAPSLAVVDERFHTALIRTPSLSLGRVTAERPAPDRAEGWLVAELLKHDAGMAIRAVQAGRTMAKHRAQSRAAQADGQNRGNAGRTADHLA